MPDENIWKQRAYEMLSKVEQLEAKIEELTHLLQEQNTLLQEVDHIW